LSEFEAATSNASRTQNGQGRPSTDELFSKIDTDGDGTISKSEFTASLDQANGSVQSNSEDILQKLLEALANEENATASTTGDTSSNSLLNLTQMLTTALYAYQQFGANGSTLGNYVQSLTGSGLSLYA
jgi:Ca2+-binding EF-hand superfamily protein